MNKPQEPFKTIHRELLSFDKEVRAEFLSHFSSEALAFSEEMGQAVSRLHLLDSNVASMERAVISTVVRAAITLNILSFKLLLSGHLVAAGNSFRQGVEAIALSILCSDKDLPMLSSFVKQRYSTKNAVRDVGRHWKRLGLVAGAHEQLREAERFYGNYSHVTMLTIASMVPLSGSGDAAYVGTSFDVAKLDAYRKEVNGRVSLSQVFVNFIQAVEANVSRWP